MLAQAAKDTLLDPVLAARRDSLSSATHHARGTPRAHGDRTTCCLVSGARLNRRELAGHASVKALLDSLTDIERERDASATSGGADPVFVALTARATEIGRAFQTIGVRDAIAFATPIAALAAPARPTASELAQADTMRRIVARDSADAALSAATAQLEAARLRLEDLDRRAERARALANPLSAPPYAMLASAIVFGMVLGFGAALTQELRRPRIADAREAERVAGARVISVIRPRPPSPERGRRMADRVAPPHIDPGNDAHQLVWLFVAPPASSLSDAHDLW